MSRAYHSYQSFVDLLFLTVLSISACFALAFILIKIENSKATVESKVEFLITVEWSPDMPDDVDTYVEDPNGALVFFRRREDALMHLDRDDIGDRNDVVVLPDGTRFEYKENREMVSIRGNIPGEYVVSVHMYTKRVPKPCEVSVKIEKINPYSMVYTKKVVLNQMGDEESICRFIINKEGKVTDVILDLPKKLATINNVVGNDQNEDEEEIE